MVPHGINSVCAFETPNLWKKVTGNSSCSSDKRYEGTHFVFLETWRWNHAGGTTLEKLRNRFSVPVERFFFCFPFLPFHFFSKVHLEKKKKEIKKMSVCYCSKLCVNSAAWPSHHSVVWHTRSHCRLWRACNSLIPEYTWSCTLWSFWFYYMKCQSCSV